MRTRQFIFIFTLFLFSLSVCAQSYEIRLGPIQDVPWYYRLDADYTTPESLIFAGDHDYNYDSEFQNGEIIPILVKKEYPSIVQAVDKKSLTLQKPLVYTRTYKSEDGEEYYMREYQRVEKGENIEIYGTGFSNENDVYTWKKIITREGQVVEDWKRISKVFTIPEKCVVNYSVSREGDTWMLTAYFRKKSASTYHLTEFYRIEKDQSTTKIGQLGKLPADADAYPLFSREGNIFYCFYRTGMGPFGFFAYDMAENKMIASVKNPVDFGKKVKAHPYLSFVDQEKGIVYIAGGYQDKSSGRPKTDGLYCLGFDYRNGKTVNIQFTPFTGTIGIDNRGPMDPGKKDHQLGNIIPTKLAKYEDGSLLMEYGVDDPQSNALCYFACKFSAGTLQVEWNTYLCSVTETSKISMLNGSYHRFTTFDGKVLENWVNTRDADLTAGNYREAIKGKEKILMNVRVGADGVRKAYTVFAFKDKPEMKDFHPYHIKFAENGEYWFRFRQKKDSFTFGLIKRH